MNRLLRLSCTTFLIISYHFVSGQIESPQNDTTICAGESVILQAVSNSYIYNWNTGDLLRNITVSPTITTSYSLRVFMPDTETELIANGDFDFGNTDFNSEYVYCPDPVISSENISDSLSLWREGRYAVDNNPKKYHANFSNCKGYTGNRFDNYLIINGTPGETLVVWGQTITVNPNQYYVFSAWACNVHPDNPARLEFMIDGVLMGDYIEPSSGVTCNWEEFYSLWYSGTKTSIEISIVNKNTARTGNDYALDGISFNPLIEVSDMRTVTVVNSATVNAGSDQTGCNDLQVVLSARALNHTEFFWSTSGDGIFDAPNNLNSNYTPGSVDISNELVVLTAIASNSTCGSARDDINITFHPGVDLGADREICSGDTITLDAGNTGSIYSWSTGETSQAIRVSETGVYSVMVTDVYGCSTGESVNVTVHTNPVVDLGADREIFGNEIITLDAGSGYSSYHWNTDSNRRSIEIGDAGDYSVEVENEYGCIAQSSITVKQQESKILVPNVFTPNGKGANKIFYPVFKGAVINFEMYIYSRWGKQVFEIKKDMLADNELKHEGWDGTYKGKDAETGVYVWLIFYEGKERARGTVTLLR